MVTYMEEKSALLPGNLDCSHKFRKMPIKHPQCGRFVTPVVKSTCYPLIININYQNIKIFHHYFFTLAPDDKYIKYTLDKAMYLVDETGLAQYNTLKEKGFYNNIMGTSAVFSIFCDSIKMDMEKMEFTYYGHQRIERRTSILTRELVTAGQLKKVPRTENNPHGLLIVNWRTLLNKDVEQKTKNNY